MSKVLVDITQKCFFYYLDSIFFTYSFSKENSIYNYTSYMASKNALRLCIVQELQFLFLQSQ